jgi:ribosomal protein S18 acetylase RimI-like enzyme
MWNVIPIFASRKRKTVVKGEENNMLDIVPITEEIYIYHLLEQFSDILPSLSKGEKFRKEIAAKFSQHGIVLVAQDVGGNPCGFAAFYANDTVNFQAYLSMIGVKRNIQHSGIGTQLISAVERYAAQNKMTSIKLEVNKENLSAIRFYKRRNYLIAGETDHSFYYQKKLS